MTDLSPREIVSELDRFIVGQHDAKRAVAVALRNRWRRKRVPDDLRDEVTPKNILMIGPTGVGDVLEPEHGVAAVGSGGNYALSAARALIEETQLDAEQIARKAMKIAADICVYTNGNLTVETLGD